jgi:hypothetical protein
VNPVLEGSSPSSRPPLLLDAIGSQRGRLPREQGSIPCRSARSTGLPPWRRWFARLSEKQEDQVRFLGTALPSSPCRSRSGSSLDSKSGRAGFNSLATCHALVAQLEEHRFRKPGVVGSIPTEGTRSTVAVSQPWSRGEAPERHSGQCGFESRQQLQWARSSAGELSVCTRATRVRIPASPLPCQFWFRSSVG